MPEKELFHEHLESLYKYFGKGAVFTNLTQASKYCGIDTRTLQADKTFPIKKMGGRYKVSIINLARWLA